MLLSHASLILAAKSFCSLLLFNKCLNTIGNTLCFFIFSMKLEKYISLSIVILARAKAEILDSFLTTAPLLRGIIANSVNLEKQGSWR